ncbi:VWA domain-containing protein [Oxalobacter vibrioformis]|uniref:VWA domain-containing protein n=1 Tax=Oxalobacter vibrioformis TaxID=933080 RepID=A0A9E9LYN2_9BURK|nr:VWA domain-containing protein [Oxalobacter vibrioformis]WAW10060.1 VWA domain-containing protein [Oxalobacter vibrioformis]
MLVDFFLHLKERRVPVTITEFLALLEALQAGMANYSLDDFYALARICLVKNEAHYDRFDVAFAEYFEKIRASGENGGAIPEAWLQNATEKVLSADELALLDTALNDTPETPRELTPEEEKPVDEESDKLFGRGGSGKFGAGGINPEGLRMDDTEVPRQGSVKAWNSREFKGLDDEVELGTRNMKVALRRLRKFAREGVPDELDLDETIRSTAKNAGWLDLVMRPERKNKVKVLLFFDTGGSMTPHLKICEELFSAARSEFKHMDYFYFHNCVYDTVWKYDGPSFTTHYPIQYITSKFGKDYKLIFVGDATMGPTEISEPLNNTYQQTHSRHSGETWMRSLLLHFRHAVWLNPEEERFWNITQSIEMIRDIMEDRMFPLTLRGLDDAMRALSK